MSAFLQGAEKRNTAKARKKTIAAKRNLKVVLSTARASGVTLERKTVRGNPYAEIDQFGFPRGDKYQALGVRCKENVAIALREGFVYTVGAKTFATTEEQVLYGEMRRRGYTVGLGTSPDSFLPQSYVAGYNVDFEVWQQGTRIALRPQNDHWHGGAAERSTDQQQDDAIRGAGYILEEIWSHDSLRDVSMEYRMDQILGRA